MPSVHIPDRNRDRTMIKRSYEELRLLPSFLERFEYLRLKGAVGESTFGFDRYINQAFYRSKEWKDMRHFIISRDNGNDLGVPGYEIHDAITIHHMNPMTVDAITEGSLDILDPDNLISVTHNTHNAIHYSDASRLAQPMVERRPNDTIAWRRISQRG